MHHGKLLLPWRKLAGVGNDNKANACKALRMSFFALEVSLYWT